MLLYGLEEQSRSVRSTEWTSDSTAGAGPDALNSAPACVDQASRPEKKKRMDETGEARSAPRRCQCPEPETIGAPNATLRLALGKAEGFGVRHGYD